MERKKVTDYLFLIKHLVDSRESLSEYQANIEAMLLMVLEKDLIDFPSLKLHVYLRELNDTVSKCLSLTDDLIGSASRVTTLLMNFDLSTPDSGKLETIL